MRHTFDIFDDQLLSLREITLTRQQASGTRVLLGDLVQEALDRLITSERNDQRMVERMTERSNQSSNDGSFYGSNERTIVRTDSQDE